MKTNQVLTVALILLLNSALIFGQNVPKTINYQGVLKNSSGVIVDDGSYDITFKLYDAETGGTEIWIEAKEVNVENGIFSTQLGSSNPINLPFNNVYWLGVSIGSEDELIPRLKLTSVPYSFMTMNVMDGAITAAKIGNNELVKSVNGLKDNVNLVAGSNVTITPDGNNLTIAASGGVVSGSGTVNHIPFFDGTNTLSSSTIYQSPGSGNIGIGTVSPEEKLDVTGNVKVSGNINPQGGISATNPITIQTLADSLVICAGTSRVTIKSTGEVIITSQNISFKSAGTLNLSGETVNIAGNDININAVNDFKLKSVNTNIESIMWLKLKGMNCKMESAMELELKGLNITSEAGVNSMMRATMITIQSTGPNTIKGLPVMIN